MPFFTNAWSFIFLTLFALAPVAYAKPCESWTTVSEGLESYLGGRMAAACKITEQDREKIRSWYEKRFVPANPNADLRACRFRILPLFHRITMGKNSLPTEKSLYSPKSIPIDYDWGKSNRIYSVDEDEGAGDFGVFFRSKFSHYSEASKQNYGTNGALGIHVDYRIIQARFGISARTAEHAIRTFFSDFKGDFISEFNSVVEDRRRILFEFSFWIGEYYVRYRKLEMRCDPLPRFSGNIPILPSRPFHGYEPSKPMTIQAPEIPPMPVIEKLPEPELTPLPTTLPKKAPPVYRGATRPFRPLSEVLKPLRNKLRSKSAQLRCPKFR